jgi:hypothetical protein
MADDLEQLKKRLWKQFNRACDLAENGDSGTPDSRAANRQAAGTLGLAIVEAERELRDREGGTKTFDIKSAHIKPAKQEG